MPAGIFQVYLEIWTAIFVQILTDFLFFIYLSFVFRFKSGLHGAKNLQVNKIQNMETTVNQKAWILLSLWKNHLTSCPNTTETSYSQLQ